VTEGCDERRRHGKSRRKVVTEGVVTENNRSRRRVSSRKIATGGRDGRCRHGKSRRTVVTEGVVTVNRDGRS
jgi:hypothetical protein